MPFWIAKAPVVQGEVGTGPVDLALATQVLLAPNGFDLPRGAGEVFDRAYRWFLDAAEKSTSQMDRSNNYLGAFRSLNNLGVYCLT